MKTVILIALSLFQILPACVRADAGPAGGGVSGRVVEEGTAIPLPGVNVFLKGTLLGSTTNAKGEFEFSGVPGGTYGVTFSIVGYQRKVVPAVAVEEGQMVRLNVELTPVAIQTEPVIVTATRSEQSLQESPVSVSVLDAAGIDFRNSLTIDDALRYISGVNMTEFQVSIRGSSGYSRGAGSRVLMLVDGIPLMTGDTGEINYETVPAGEVDRIEVVKVASSALYGANALGGVINIITKPIPMEPQTRLRLYGGLYGEPSHEQWDWGGGTRSLGGFLLSHSRKIGDLGFRLYLSRDLTDGYRRNDSRRRLNAAVKARYDFSTFSALTTTFNYFDQTRESFLFWRGLDKPHVPPDDQLGQTIHSRRFYASAVYNQVVSSSFSYSLQGLWYRNRFTDTVSEGGGNESLSDVVRGEFQLIWMPSGSHAVTAGVDGRIDRVDATLFGVRSGGGIGLYAQDEITLSEHWSLTIGARFDIQNVDSVETTSQISPKGAIVFTPQPGTVLRASAGRGFRAPTVAEAFTSTVAAGIVVVPNPLLNPERSMAYEIGIRQIFGGFALLDVAAFQTDFSDLIESGFNEFGQAQFNNVTDARIRGVEITSTLALLTRTWFVDVGYTYVDPQDWTGDRRDVLKYRPRHMLYVSTRARIGAFEIGLDYRHLSRVERIDEEFATIIRDGDQRVPINVVDARVGYDLATVGVPIHILLNVYNLLQYNYVEIMGNITPPRTLLLTIEARF
ncbi:MAG: TonB-dependent receptor [Bacteroidota bacterium]